MGRGSETGPGTGMPFYDCSTCGGSGEVSSDRIAELREQERQRSAAVRAQIDYEVEQNAKRRRDQEFADAASCSTIDEMLEETPKGRTATNGLMYCGLCLELYNQFPIAGATARFLYSSAIDLHQDRAQNLTGYDELRKQISSAESVLKARTSQRKPGERPQESFDPKERVRQSQLLTLDSCASGLLFFDDDARQFFHWKTTLKRIHLNTLGAFYLAHDSPSTSTEETAYYAMAHWLKECLCELRDHWERTPSEFRKRSVDRLNQLAKQRESDRKRREAEAERQRQLKIERSKRTVSERRSELQKMSLHELISEFGVNDPTCISRSKNGLIQDILDYELLTEKIIPDSRRR